MGSQWRNPPAVTPTGHSLLSRPPAWDPRWRSNLWGLWLLPRSPWLLLKCWTSAKLATQTHVHGRERLLSPACYLPFFHFFFFLFCTDREMAQWHMAAWPRVSENQLLDSLLRAREGVCRRSVVGIREDARFWLSHMRRSPFFFSFAWPCVHRCAPPFLLDFHLYFFPGCLCVGSRGARSHDCLGFKRWRLWRNWQRSMWLHMAVPLMKQYLYYMRWRWTELYWIYSKSFKWDKPNYLKV